MSERMKNPAMVLPDALPALMGLSASIKASGVPEQTLDLLHLRASQINGCSFCVEMHTRALKKAGEWDEKIATVAAWRDAPYFTDAERAALALAESVTRLSDTPDAVPDAVWEEAKRHYDDVGIAGLLLSVATVNVWNRLNVATRQVAGAWKG
ncbi:MAG: carboxymuconolactone decarboxylase family protein [Armatimonadetes bacterium]|nr:carboxymuconolactone decarboxylase family protein [Armatimonadota bacterium]